MELVFAGLGDAGNRDGVYVKKTDKTWHYEIKGSTEDLGWPKNISHGKAPLLLQDHGDNSRVSYRNIWLRELD